MNRPTCPKCGRYRDPSSLLFCGPCRDRNWINQSWERHKPKTGDLPQPKTRQLMTKEQLLDLHDKTSQICRQTMEKKNTDYCGGSSDPLANFRISEMVGVPPALGILMRMTDKMQRIRSFVQNGTMAVKAESYKDACEDIVNYAILLKALLMEKNGEFNQLDQIMAKHAKVFTSDAPIALLHDVSDAPAAFGSVGVDREPGDSRSSV